MPILETPQPDDGLSQGDVLKGVALFATQSTWGQPAHERASAVACMIVSRPCVAAHKSQIVVAAVERAKDAKPPEIETFDDLQGFLTGARDGLFKPDSFYLGQITPLGEGRYYAKLDALFTIKVPGIGDLPAVLKEHRVARLHQDFLRDLHVRLFTNFAKLGFDDYAWYPDADLEWAVGMCEKELSDARVELRQGLSMGFTNDKHRQSIQAKVAAKEAQLKPLKWELEQRRAKAAPQSWGKGQAIEPSGGESI